jgi:hypothetical protein
MIEEKCTRDDLIIYEIFKNPVLFGEFLMNIDRTEYEEEFILSIYQKEYLCDFNHYVSMMAARAVGKTQAISLNITWALIFNIFPENYIVYSVPSKVHLEPVFANLTRIFRSNSLLQHYIERNGGINGSEFSISLKNQSKLMCRIAGMSGTGANVIGLHTPYVWVDESGYYPWGTWVEMQPILNTWQSGFKMSTSGVPTGLREKNVLWHTDQENTSYTKHRISASQNPRFTNEDKQKAIEQYNGEGSDDYIHLVLGQHGKPVFSLFDRNAFDIQSYPVYKFEFDGVREGDNLVNVIGNIAILPPIPEKNKGCIVGVDLGYTEPTAIWIMYEEPNGYIKFHAKIKLTKVSYPLQEKLIDLLDTKYQPYIIGIDKGSAGISVVQNLLEHRDYLHKDYKKKVVPIDFSSWVSMGIDSEGKEIKQKTKPFSVSILQEYTNSRKIIYSYTDTEMITELERMTYSKSPTGEITYKTLTQRGGKRGDDHFTAALLCAMTSYYMVNDYSLFATEKKRLMRASWW